VPPNLTPAGPLKAWSDGEIFRAVGELVDRNGHRLLMPSAIRTLSDADIHAIIAYLRSQPPVPNETGDNWPSLLLAALFGANLTGDMPVPPRTAPIVAPPKGRTAAYGKYVVDFQGCRDCHGLDLTGGTSPISPKGPNLVQRVPNWTQEQFIKTLRTGVDPAGHKLSDQMPWRIYARLDDDELIAVYQYLHDYRPAQ
jgi:cytochrome c553